MPSPRALAVFALSFLATLPASASAQGSPTVTGAKVGRLLATVPASSDFLVHGTVPLPPLPFRRGESPWVLVDPDGNALPTQWELVATLQNFQVVELSAIAHNPGTWNKREVFTVHPGSSKQTFSGFDPALLQAVSRPDTFRLWMLDQQGRAHVQTLTTGGKPTRIHRLGSARITFENDFQSSLGGVQVWIDLVAGSEQVGLILNWHNGGLPAQPDLYFTALGLEVPSGLRWTPLLPDPAVAEPLLVKSGKHVLPQRWERSFRVIVHRDGTTPDLSLEGWAVGDWSKGGYMAQSLAVPSLAHTTIDLVPKQLDDFDRLRRLQPTSPGSPPVNFLWPAQGIYYGGMTGGVEIEQFHAVPLAYSGQPEGLLSEYVEQLRYASRQMGCIYQANGLPVDQDTVLNPDGSQPFDLFNNVFLGNPPKDAPFDFSKTGPGNGFSTYDPNLFAPIDSQHLVRRTKANKALVWLDNDPLAKRYSMMDAELGRMAFYEGTGGRLSDPVKKAQGSELGRGEAWVADAMAFAYAISDPAWRRQHLPWFQRFVGILGKAQMANGLLSALDHGKMATSPPYGDGHTAFYFVHRANEQIFLMHALRAIQHATGIRTDPIIARTGEGLWRFAWKVGTDGPLSIFPVGPVAGSRYSKRVQIPSGLTTTVLRDPYHVANALAFAEEAGAVGMQPALLAHTNTQTLSGAKAVFEGWGLSNIANRAAALSLFQKLLP